MEFALLLKAIKGFTTAVSAIRTAGSVRAWLEKDRRDPLRRALDRTTTHFEKIFPNIGQQLLSLFEKGEFVDQLEKLALQDEPDLSRVAGQLAERYSRMLWIAE